MLPGGVHQGTGLSEPLDPRGDPVELGRVTVRAQGVSGAVESYGPASPGTVRDTAASIGIEEVLDEQGFRELATVELTGLNVVESRRARTTRGETTPPSVEIEVPAPTEGWEQALLTRTDDGVYTWSFADGRERQSATRAGSTRVYRVEILPDSAPATDAQRGLVGAAVRRVVKVLAFKAGAAAGERLVAGWEEKNRPHLVRKFAPGSHREPPSAPISADEWNDLSRGRTLVFVHGTHSRCSTAFNSLPVDALRRLHDVYGGRVIGFDHPTLSVTPSVNAETFLGTIPEGVSIEADIISHSRGGLVARILAEREPPNFKVHRVAFVATPNNGTALADSKNVKTFLDAYTNFLSLIPGIPVVGFLDSVLTLAKGIGVGIHSALDGLQSMAPRGKFLEELNRGRRGRCEYFGIAANFEPANKGMKLWAADKLFDRVFRKAQNDLIVPTEGVAGANGSGYFPIGDPLVFPSEQGVHHSGYFDNEKVLRLLAARFTA